MVTRLRGMGWRRWAILAALLLAAFTVAGYLVLSDGRPGDYSDPGAAFSPETTTTAESAPPPRPPKKGHPADDGFRWPTFGLDDRRTRVLRLRTPFRPPFRVAWRKRTKQLLEFTPVLCGRSVYLLGDAGDLFKISRWTGRIRWRRKLGTLAASSPVCGGGRVYAVLLRRHGSDDGRVVALDAGTGRIAWSRRLPSRSESSPLLYLGRLYFGSEDGTLYALRARGGRLVWKYRAGGAIKGAPALADGRLFFGTYGGRVYAVRRADGRLLWTSSAGGGNFYSSPSVRYGRVYLGSTNGAVYSLSARTGATAWRKQTGGYVYASPAVGTVAGGPPTVWIGSYDGVLYALNAKSGAVRWQRTLGGRLSGSPSVVGDLVFQATIRENGAWAVGARTGRTVWRARRPGYTSVVADGRRIYMALGGSLFALDPRGRRFSPSGRQPRRKTWWYIGHPAPKNPPRRSRGKSRD